MRDSVPCSWSCCATGSVESPPSASMLSRMSSPRCGSFGIGLTRSFATSIMACILFQSMISDQAHTALPSSTRNTMHQLQETRTLHWLVRSPLQWMRGSKIRGSRAGIGLDQGQVHPSSRLEIRDAHGLAEERRARSSTALPSNGTTTATKRPYTACDCPIFAILGHPQPP